MEEIQSWTMMVKDSCFNRFTSRWNRLCSDTAFYFDGIRHTIVYQLSHDIQSQNMKKMQSLAICFLFLWKSIHADPSWKLLERLWSFCSNDWSSIRFLWRYVSVATMSGLRHVLPWLLLFAVGAAAPVDVPSIDDDTTCLQAEHLCHGYKMTCLLVRSRKWLTLMHHATDQDTTTQCRKVP